jgi:hypothetical protein
VDTETAETFVDDTLVAKVNLVATDESSVYRRVGQKHPHQIVNHGRSEYVSGAAHTCTIDGYWSLLKRQIYGIHHRVSPKHPDRYVAESSWRCNRRQSGGGARVNTLLSDATGRLTYKALIG